MEKDIPFLTLVRDVADWFGRPSKTAGFWNEWRKESVRVFVENNYDRAEAERIQTIAKQKAEQEKESRVRFCKLPDLDFKTKGPPFSRLLMNLIKSKNISEVDAYRKANVDRRLFSRIRSICEYHPEKKTACAFAVSLGLNLAEAEELLKSAGYALSDTIMFDVIVKYCIENGISNVFDANQILYEYHQELF